MFDPFSTPSVFGRTKAEPAIYYMPVKPLSDDPAIVEQTKEKVGSSLWKLYSKILVICTCLRMLEHSLELRHFRYKCNENVSYRFDIVIYQSTTRVPRCSLCDEY